MIKIYFQKKLIKTFYFVFLISSPLLTSIELAAIESGDVEGAASGGARPITPLHRAVVINHPTPPAENTPDNNILEETERMLEAGLSGSLQNIASRTAEERINRRIHQHTLGFYCSLIVGGGAFLGGALCEDVTTREAWFGLGGVFALAAFVNAMNILNALGEKAVLEGEFLD